MSDDRPQQNIPGESGLRSWREIIAQALNREPKDREQLTALLREAQQRNLLDVDALAMIEGVMQVADMQVRDIMIPRTQMVVVNLSDAPEQILPVMVESAHSRFPVIGENRDEVAGILLAKDLLGYFGRENKAGFSLREMLRPAVFIPESKRLNVLLKEFRSSRNHMAIVVDEYGGVAGLVTIEDVIEQIVGDIEDEYDYDEDVFITRHTDTEFTVKALTPIGEFNEQFDTHFSDEEFDTVGGMLMQELGHMPQRGEQIAIGKYHFKVLRADSRRVYLVHLSVVESNGEGHEAATSPESE
jgi:magnesium and cobalt transporter